VKLFQDPPLADALGQAGAMRWRSDFTEEVFACRFHALLGRKIFGRNGGAR